MILAADLGGSALKAGMVDAHGRLLALAARPQATRADARGHAEQDPERWWRDLGLAVGEVLAQSAPVRVDALCLCGVARTQVFAGGDGNARRPAISWRDGRASEEAEAIRAVQAGDTTGGCATFGPINGFHPLARILWVRRHEPGVFDAVEAVLQAKDYLNFRLTGRRGSDPASNGSLLSRRRPEAPAWPLLQALGIDTALVPRLQAPHALLGPVQSGLPAPLDALAGVPVFTGAMDTWAAVLGSGAHRPGGAYIVSGTSDVLGLITPEPREVDGLVTLPWGAGLYHLGGPSQAGGDCLAWLAGILGRAGVDPLLDTLAREARRPVPALFLPYLQGERVPLWEPDARGVFLGLGRDHRDADLAWAVLEGVALAARDVLERATGGRRDEITEIRISGGGARSDAWCRVRADALGLPIARTAAPEAGLLGAAMIALVGLGRFPDYAAAQDALCRVERRFEPEPAHRGFYDALFARFREAQAATLPIGKALVEIGRRPGNPGTSAAG